MTSRSQRSARPANRLRSTLRRPRARYRGTTPLRRSNPHRRPGPHVRPRRPRLEPKPSREPAPTPQAAPESPTPGADAARRCPPQPPLDLRRKPPRSPPRRPMFRRQAPRSPPSTHCRSARCPAAGAARRGVSSPSSGQESRARPGLATGAGGPHHESTNRRHLSAGRPTMVAGTALPPPPPRAADCGPESRPMARAIPPSALPCRPVPDPASRFHRRTGPPRTSNSQRRPLSLTGPAWWIPPSKRGG